MKMMLNHLFHLFIELSSSMFCFHQLMITLVLIILIFHHSKSSTEINPSTIFFFEGLWLIFFLIIISFHWILLHHWEIKVMFILILQLTQGLNLIKMDRIHTASNIKQHQLTKYLLCLNKSGHLIFMGPYKLAILTLSLSFQLFLNFYKIQNRQL